MLSYSNQSHAILFQPITHYPIPTNHMLSYSNQSHNILFQSRASDSGAGDTLGLYPLQAPELNWLIQC